MAHTCRACMVPCALQIHAAYMLATLKITRRRALRACLGGLLGDFVVTVRHVRGSTRQVSCRGPPDEPPHAPLPSLCYFPGSPWISPAKGTPRLRARHGGNRLSIARAFELPTTPPYPFIPLFLLWYSHATSVWHLGHERRRLRGKFSNCHWLRDEAPMDLQHGRGCHMDLPPSPILLRLRLGNRLAAASRATLSIAQGRLKLQAFPFDLPRPPKHAATGNIWRPIPSILPYC